MLCTSCGEAVIPPVALPMGESGGGVTGVTGVGVVADMATLKYGLEDVQHETDCAACAKPKDGGNMADTSVINAGVLGKITAVTRLEGDDVRSADPGVSTCDVAWCRNDGTVGVFDWRVVQAGVEEFTEGVPAEQATESGHIEMLSARSVQLPAETFSEPVAFTDFIIAGCRDDHLYCLRWQ